jgi:hypothetical protein
MLLLRMMTDTEGQKRNRRQVLFGCPINARCLLLALLTLLVACFSVAPDGGAYTAANVLLINAYHPGYRWSDQLVNPDIAYEKMVDLKECTL